MVDDATILFQRKSGDFDHMNMIYVRENYSFLQYNSRVELLQVSTSQYSFLSKIVGNVLEVTLIAAILLLVLSTAGLFDSPEQLFITYNG